MKSPHVSLVAGNTVDSLFMDTSLEDRLLGLDMSLIRWTVGATVESVDLSHLTNKPEVDGVLI